ncbi:hypothetical protein, partial [Lysinibacillus sp. NPDC059133]|uniref:hypothetical protein n=1 Tax=Lysinibacillus sp. NPDC059133 TaxID=3346737 RepID=UPI0036A1C873
PPGSFALCESVATATNVLSVRKRSDSNNNNKAPSRNGNQPHVLPKSHILLIQNNGNIINKNSVKILQAVLYCQKIILVIL